MQPTSLLEILHTAQKLKDTLRHCWSTQGRRESVAEHSWRLALMAYFLTDEFPELDREKLLVMCLIHDLGEAFTGDIPTFEKTDADAQREDQLLIRWLKALPEPYGSRLPALWREMEARQSQEAKVYKALDKLEAVIAHNEADIETWLPLEYDLQLTYAEKATAFSPYLTRLHRAVNDETREKIREHEAGGLAADAFAQ